MSHVTSQIPIEDSVFILMAKIGIGRKRASNFDVVVRRVSHNTVAHRVPPEGGHVPVCGQVSLHRKLTHTSVTLSAAQADLKMNTINANCSDYFPKY